MNNNINDNLHELHAETTMVESITRINRYRLLLLVLCTLVIASFVYAQLLLGPFWESINDSKAEQPQVLSEDGNCIITRRLFNPIRTFFEVIDFPFLCCGMQV